MHPQIYPNHQMSQSELKKEPPPTLSGSTHSLFADKKTESSRSRQAACPGGTGSSTISLLLLPALQFNPELGRTTCLPRQPLPPRRYSGTTHTNGHSWNYTGPREGCGWHISAIILRCPGVYDRECSVSIQSRTPRFSQGLRVKSGNVPA